MSGPQADGDEVVIGRPGEAMASFGLPDVASDGSGMRVPILLSAEGVTARTSVELESWSGGPASLIAFFEELAASWRGWPGAKAWSDDGANVSMRATHDGVGVVSLSISASPFAGWDGSGSWELRVVVPVEPGSLAPAAEKMKLLIAGRG